MSASEVPTSTLAHLEDEVAGGQSAEKLEALEIGRAVKRRRWTERGMRLGGRQAAQIRRGSTCHGSVGKGEGPERIKSVRPPKPAMSRISGE